MCYTKMGIDSRGRLDTWTAEHTQEKCEAKQGGQACIGYMNLCWASNDQALPLCGVPASPRDGRRSAAACSVQGRCSLLVTSICTWILGGPFHLSPQQSTTTTSITTSHHAEPSLLLNVCRRHHGHSTMLMILVQPFLNSLFATNPQPCRTSVP